MRRARPRHAAPVPLRARAAVFVPAVVVVGLAGAAAVTVAGGNGSPPPAPSTSTTAATTTALATPTTAAPTTATTRDPVLGNGEAVTFAFAGDTNFEGANAARLDADPASVLAPFAPVLSAADVAVVNMETALGTGGTPVDKAFTFRAPPAALEAYRAAGVDAVSAANNHGLDFGPEALDETLAAERDHGFPIIGIGATEDEAYAPYRVDVRGQRIAVIAATQVLDGNLIDDWTAGPDQPGLASAKRVDRLVRAVAEARSDADTVVVFLHWGIERQTCPSADQEALARRLVDAGADVVVGGHAHRLQGGGRLGGALVAYGLGNFAFGAPSPASATTGVLTVTVTGRRVDGYRWVPGRIVDGQPRPLDGPDAEAAVADWDALRACTNLTP